MAGTTPVYLMTPEEWGSLSWEEKGALHEECGGAQPYHANYLGCRLSHAIFSGVEVPLERLGRMSDGNQHHRAVSIIEAVYNEYGAPWATVHPSLCAWAVRTVTPETAHEFFRRHALKHPEALGALYNEGLRRWGRRWAAQYTGPPDGQTEEEFLEEFGVPEAQPPGPAVGADPGRQGGQPGVLLQPADQDGAADPLEGVARPGEAARGAHGRAAEREQRQVRRAGHRP